MSSTNKTTNYELSQFIGTDKPAWLVDYNQDMSKIDTGLNTAQTTATGADGKANANTTNIGDLTNLTTGVKTSLVAAINEVDGHADTAQETASTAQTTAAGADSKATQAINNTLKFNLSTTGECTLVPTQGTVGQYSHLYYASNSDGTLGKIYGSVIAGTVTGQTVRATSPFRPQSKITISGVLAQYAGDKSVLMTSFTVDTDGTIEFTFPSGWGAGGGHVIYFPPCIYFMEDFGDPSN